MLALAEVDLPISEEHQLIALASSGDKQAFKSLYETHHKRVYALAYRLAGGHDLAHDITQECFIRLWDKLPSYRGESQFSTWLHRLCVNQTLTMIKSQKSFWNRLFSADALPEYSINDDYHELDQMILKLPERARVVFVLFAIEGYRHEEIADLLNMAVGTSKAQYYRARQLLKEMLS
ncbi:RNA polymerase sigma factor [Parashewanella spongiae]|uniref:RNA polymerase sigma factor n=1 Tax=Parashewanella spongiae TaxID=342950 RepID=A0A3A6UFZ8_9GAMM|nr:RNA polymerase sigma factor [Parashewanella spongiae]MCL1078112.1 RNA polymerase sigma factor [Parashewanella spongiae]RJY16358.1 RNA polymerase sigma factor [Parashewanella spongiae]